MKNQGAMVVIGADVSEVKPKLDSVSVATQALGKEVGASFNGWVGPAANAGKATKGLEGTLKSLRGEIKGGDRLVGFYVKQVAAIAPISKEASAAIGGIAGVTLELANVFKYGLTPLTAFLLAFEVIKSAAEWFGALKEAATAAFKALVEGAYKTRQELENLNRVLSGGKAMSSAEAEFRKLEYAQKAVAEAKQAYAEDASIANRNELAELTKIYDLLGGEVAYVSALRRFMQEAGDAATELGNKTKEAAKRAAEARRELEKGAEESLRKSYFDQSRTPDTSFMPEIRSYGGDNLGEAVPVPWTLGRYVEPAGALSGSLMAPAAQTAFGAADNQGPNLPGLLPVDLSTWRVKTRGPTPEEAAKESAEAAKKLKEEWTSVGDAVNSAFSSLGSAIGGTAGKLVSLFGEMIQKAIQLAIAIAASSGGPLGWLNAAAAAAALIATIASVAEPRAMGGPVYPGSPYLVGERGPELFIPNEGGAISPAGSFGGTTNIYVSAMDARSFTDFAKRQDRALLGALDGARRARRG